MSAVPVPFKSNEVLVKLDQANSQLALYARDLKRIVDVERRKSRELAAANARLQRLDRMKTDFLTFIAHELRTPLVAMSAVDIADPHGDPETQAALIDLIRQGYERLTTFVEKGLGYFSWLAEDRPQSAGTTDLTRLVWSVIRELPGLAAPGVELSSSMPAGSCPVRGDPKWLAVVVQTMLDNALKFSGEKPQIRLELGKATTMAILTVADSGRGFPPEMADELLRPFTIIDVAHHSQGSGLSLALAAAIVKDCGGQLRAESRGMGQGAMFCLELPLLPLQGIAPQPIRGANNEE